MSARDINDGRVSISLEPMGDGAVPLLEERRAALSESFLEVEEPVEAPVQDPWMMFWRENGFWVFFFLVCATSVAIVAVKIAQGRPSAEVSQTVEILSIPIVSTIFTWCHIWLAVQMCFYPVEFFGCCKIGNTGLGLGWQGIVPRKASKMAEKSCELMVGRLVKMEEIIDRFTFDEFFFDARSGDGAVPGQCEREGGGQAHSQAVGRAAAECEGGNAAQGHGGHPGQFRADAAGHSRQHREHSQCERNGGHADGRSP
mmetsp:Transcript_52588/g.112607  ORF Transcript_52588/g.112607 Transcript_52588/m.112607 type:complete len:257 (+) Transcript_52588:48-818(+)